MALKHLHDAMLSQWVETLYIPVRILNKMALWLTRQQNGEGAFVETSEHYYDRSFLVNQTSCFCAVFKNPFECFVVSVCALENQPVLRL